MVSELANMLKVFSIFAVFLYNYAGDADPKFYLLQTQAQASSRNTKSEDFKLEETKQGNPRKSTGHTGLYHIKTKYLLFCIIH